MVAVNIILVVIGAIVLTSIILAVIRIRKFQAVLNNKEMVDYSVLQKTALHPLILMISR